METVYDELHVDCELVGPARYLVTVGESQATGNIHNNKLVACVLIERIILTMCCI